MLVVHCIKNQLSKMIRAICIAAFLPLLFGYEATWESLDTRPLPNWYPVRCSCFCLPVDVVAACTCCASNMRKQIGSTGELTVAFGIRTPRLASSFTGASSAFLRSGQSGSGSAGLDRRTRTTRLLSTPRKVPALLIQTTLNDSVSPW